MNRLSGVAPILVTVIAAFVIIGAAAAIFFGFYEYMNWKTVNSYHADFESFESEFETVKNGLSGFPDGSAFGINYDSETESYSLTPMIGTEAEAPADATAAINRIMKGKCFPKRPHYITIRDGQIVFGSEVAPYFLVWCKNGKPKINNSYNKREYVDKINDDWYHVVFYG